MAVAEDGANGGPGMNRGGGGGGRRNCRPSISPQGFKLECVELAAAASDFLKPSFRFVCVRV